jgi:archaellum component FlaC
MEFRIMEKKDEEVKSEKITKEDLIFNELKHINKRLDSIENNDLHIEKELKDMTNVFNTKFDNQSKEFNTKFDNQSKDISNLKVEIHGVKSQMYVIIPIMVALLGLILGLYFK